MASLTTRPAAAAPTRPGDVDLLDDVEAVFVPADPPRHSALALWRPHGDPPPGAEDLLELVVPANGA
ncbi:MAG: hypothetical protein AAFO29_14475, partial [Actinomycetota bacterium]